jgi:hypothetical protein
MDIYPSLVYVENLYTYNMHHEGLSFWYKTHLWHVSTLVLPLGYASAIYRIPQQDKNENEHTSNFQHTLKHDKVTHHKLKSLTIKQVIHKI